MLQHTTQIRVRYAETDQMGVVYHANYVVWMEVGRVEAMRAAGLSYADMEKDGVKVAVMGIEVDYRAAAVYDDLVDITIKVVEANLRKMRIEYEMRRSPSGKLLATGSTRHLFLNNELRPVRCPEKYFQIFLGAL